MKSVDDLRDENARLTSTVTALETRIIALESEIEVWKRRLFGQKAERVKNNEAQASLFALLEQMGRLAAGDLAAGEVADELISDLRDEAASPSSPSPSPSPSPSRGEKRKGTAGRRKLSESDLPVHRIVLNPIGYTGGADDELVKVGEEISRHVDYQPGSHVVVEVVRPKCIKKADAGTSSSSSSSPEPAVEFFIADAAELPISKGLAGPGLLANVLVRKYADHLPLHRQERILLREGIRFGRSTLCGWVQGCAALLVHITDAMWRESKTTAPLLLTDACGVLIREPERCRRGHFQVFIDPGRHVNFRYLATSDGATIANELAGFSGMLQADAAATYHETLRRETAIIEVGCWAHARRNFFEALGFDRERALIGIGFIAKLYDAHRGAMDAAGVVDGPMRKMLASPVLDRLMKWTGGERPTLTAPSPIERALGYLERHWIALTRFLDDGRLRLDNNPSELELRHQVVGRKNWLFCATDGGATWNAITVTLIASCRIHGIEPWRYLRDVLTLLPAWDRTKVLSLAPAQWRETRQQTQTRQLLDSRQLLGRGVVHDDEDDPAR